MTWAFMLHGGAGNYEGEQILASRPFLENLGSQVKKILIEQGAQEAALFAVRTMEDTLGYNAGTGSKIQADGCIRMTACYMDSKKNKFSSVTNIEMVKNPIDIAFRLQSERFPNLAGKEAQLWAYQNGFPSYNPVSRYQIERYLECNPENAGRGTVGACVLDESGLMVAATSTGGVGNETPGRVSDDASPCGNYCSSTLSISATGIGETLINSAITTKLAALVEYGVEWGEAWNYCIKDFERYQGDGGWIALDFKGNLFQFFNTLGMRYVGENSSGVKVLS